MISGIIRTVFVVAITSILVKCATITNPSGGPKDTLPPQLIEASTENFATNFSASNIVLTFNEFVKLNNASQNIHTSPPLGKKAAFTTVKNKIFITFKEDLEENLTYHINFGNSIQDVNEGNPLNNFQFIFSTGDKIDSMAISGKLTIVNEVKISKTTLVGLYRNAKNDSAFYKEAPFYYTYVGDDGSFSFRNIKNGNYLIRALSDANGNRFYDLPNESIGYLKDSFRLDSNISNLNILLFEAEEEGRRVVSFSNNISDYQSQYTLSKALADGDNYELNFINDSIEIKSIEKLDEERKEISVFFDKTINDLNQLKTVLLVNKIVLDTLEQNISNLKSPEQEFSLENENLLNFDTLRINSTVPIARCCENIQIIDTLNGDTMLFKGNISSDNQLFITLDDRLKENNVYTLLIQDSCVFDILGGVNETYEEIIKIESLEDRAAVKLTFEGIDSSKNYIIQFLDEAKKIVGKTTITKENKTWDFINLSPATYSLKVIEDENGDGVWNSGSIKNKTFPEKIYNHPKEIVVRPNWELEETIDLASQ